MRCGRFARAIITFNAFACLAMMMTAVCLPRESMAFGLRGVHRNNQGVQRFGQEQYTQAYDRFAHGLGDLPFSAEIHYNLGRTFFENKEYEKAYRESMAASKLAGDPGTKFKSLFQAATSLGMMKKVDEAIATYQQALEIIPDSKETKTNIELLIAGGDGGGDGQQRQKDQQGKQDKDGQGQGDQQKQQQQPQQFTNQGPKPTPRPFNGEGLSKRDVENILDELRQQEEQIRAKFQREGGKDVPKQKDW